jgi:hypothetical protein
VLMTVDELDELVDQRTCGSTGRITGDRLAPLP